MTSEVYDDESEEAKKVWDAMEILEGLAETHPQIDLSNWIAAFWRIIAQTYADNSSHEEFKKDANKVIEYYKKLFNN